MDHGNGTPQLFILLVSLFKRSKNVYRKPPVASHSTQFSSATKYQLYEGEKSNHPTTFLFYKTSEFDFDLLYDKLVFFFFTNLYFISVDNVYKVIF